jgi:cytochrome c-type biogenesis protein
MSDAVYVGLPVALLAGAASFLSPCVLPLLPGYLSYMSGVSLAMVKGGQASPRKLILPTMLFVLGFSTIFVMLGATATLAGAVLQDNRLLLSRIAGALIVLMGLAFMGVLPLRWIYAERRLEMRRGQTLLGNYLMGLSFGLGWTPCIGPTLASTLLLASQVDTVGRGALLLFVYSMGLGVPFVLAALGVSKLSGALSFIRKHQKTVMRVSGALLVAFGVLLFFDQVYRISALIQKWMTAAGLETLIGI